MEQDWGSPRFVADQFHRWYQGNARSIPAPTEIKQREFAFLQFGGKAMFRHIGFPDEGAFRRYLSESSPAHSYHSSSYYQRPDADMAGKGWTGADLVFDIDADHFDLPCQHEHDKWKCRNCGAEGTGKPPEICACGKAAFEEESWLCEHCLQAAKHETQKLLDILIQDFGFSPANELVVNFSGNRGYHVHVRSKRIRGLDQSGRREVVDYMLGTGLKPEYLGFNPRAKGGRSTLADGGWRGRAGRALYDYIASADAQTVKDLKLGRKITSLLVNEKEKALTILEEGHPSMFLKAVGVGDEERLMTDLGRIMEIAVKEQAADIDTVVTTDIHRLIRLPNTLHGKTGWQVQTIQLESLPDYDPLTSAIAFRGGEAKIYVRHAPKVRIGDAEYGPYSQETIVVPMAVAMFLLCKKGARIEP
ncbi:MAG: DNA primase small subunit PriS [Candidatus Bathyarchaeia archaeon]